MKKNYLLYIIVTIWVGLTIADMIVNNRLFSELENRKLKTKVDFTIKGFFNNSFQSEYETYINDQFVLRDTWIDIKSRSEYVLGKVENNGIIYGDNEFLFEKFNNFDQNRLDINISSINSLKEKINSESSLMIVPNSYEIYKELLPVSAPVIGQVEEINSIYDKINGTNNIKLIDLMKDNKDKYIYYRTDHHWTTYGAYLAYKEFIKSVGGVPIELESLKGNTVNEFYGTYFSKAKPFNVSPDELTYYNIDNIELDIYGEKYDSLYDYEQLEIRDKYALFLRGNNALTVIKNKTLDNNKKLLVIKDSYANSLVPFLTQNYEEIHVIDLRSFMEKVDTYINNNKFDDVLILYNFINFTRDNNIVKLKY